MPGKRAFISVYNKENIVNFAEKLISEYGYEIVSTGGTYETLKNNNIKAIEISELTGFTELLGGRVKSLHPKIHAGILAQRNIQEDMEQLKKEDIVPIDMVVVNLYPFEEASKNPEINIKELVEYIDIGGVTLLRAAAKNFEYVTCVSSPDLYDSVLENLAQNRGETDYSLRKDLAIKAFQYTSFYDSLIAEQFLAKLTAQTPDKMPEIFNVSLKKSQDLRYGENPHQSAALYKRNDSIEYELLNGKELSFNNIVDMASALNIVSEFIDVPVACIIKHNNPCGVAIGKNINDAYYKAFDCDPVSAFGGIIGLNQPVTKEIAKAVKDIFFEVVIAPDFEPEALELLKAKKNLRLVKVLSDLLTYRTVQKYDIKDLPFGVLVQNADKGELQKDSFKVVTKKKPTESQVEDMVFAWKVAKHVKSNAIVVAKDKKAIGIGVGQTSRIGSMEIALAQACADTKDAVIASDGFFPAVDNIHAAAQARIGAIIQPGGSIKDKDVIEEADKYGIAMVTTSMRHFKH